MQPSSAAFVRCADMLMSCSPHLPPAAFPCPPQQAIGSYRSRFLKEMRERQRASLMAVCLVRLDGDGGDYGLWARFCWALWVRARTSGQSAG